MNTHSIPDKADVAKRFARALPEYSRHAAAQAHIAGRLLKLIQAHGSTFHSVLEIGCGSGTYTRLLQSNLQADHWHINDLCPEAANWVNADHFLPGDIEQLPLTRSYDLITAASALQWLQHPAALLAKLARHSTPQRSLLAFNVFTSQNLFQIKQLTSAGLHYPSQNDWQHWLHDARYQTLLLESEEITLWFDSPQAVLQHLKLTGVTATGRHHWNKASLQQFSTAYRQHYGGANGQVPLSYTPLYIVATQE